MNNDKETKINHVYHITWPAGTKISMDERSLEQIRGSLEQQFREAISKQPGFEFYHSIGNCNFFQHFKTADGLDFGVCHLYWEKEWKIRWLPAGCYEVIGTPSPISDEGWRIIYREHAEAMNRAMVTHARKIEKEQEEQNLSQVDDEKVKDKPKYLN